MSGSHTLRIQTVTYPLCLIAPIVFIADTGVDLTRLRRADSDNLPWLNRHDRREACWHCRKKILNPIRRSANDQYGNAFSLQVLLVRQILVQRQQYIEQWIRQSEQFAILLPRPSAENDGGAFMSNKVSG